MMKFSFSKDAALISNLASSMSSDNFKRIETIISGLNSKEINMEKIYETILQCYLFCGFPATIESLKIFKKHFPDFKKSKANYDIPKLRKLGINNCKLIYKKNYKKLIENMNFCSPDLKEWMIIEGYGKVLSRNGLSLLEREFVNVSVLCTKFYENQLYAHIKGCINLGASKNDLIKLFGIIKNSAGSSNVRKAVKLLNIICK